MILRFKDTAGRCVNIFFDRNNYNFIPDPKKKYITISADDMDELLQEIDFNCLDYEADLYRTAEQKEKDLREYLEKEEREAMPF